MRRVLLLLVLGLYGTPAPAAVPADVVSLLVASDDDPRRALQEARAQMERARARDDADALFWHTALVGRIQTKLEQVTEATASASAAATLLQRVPQPDEAQRIWLELTRFDALATPAERAQRLPQLPALRDLAESAGEAMLACEIRTLEAWTLIDLRSDDEAWLAAEGLLRCSASGQRPEYAAIGHMYMALLTRMRLSEGVRDQDPQPHLTAARQVLGQQPARFVRSLIEWEAGIALRHARQFEEALAALERARTLSESLGDEAGVAVAHLEQAAVLVDLRRAAQALELVAQGQARLERLGGEEVELRMPRIVELRVLAMTQVLHPGLSAEVDRARATLKSAPPNELRARLLRAVAAAQAALGRPAAAYESLLASIEEDRQVRVLARDAQVLRLQARYDSARRDAENAELKLRSEAARLALETEAERRRGLTAMLLAVAAMLALVVTFGWRELTRRRRLASLALRDELTGLPNRRAVEAYGREQLAQSLRLGVPITVALIDFDHFKRVNDRFGHGVGDNLLRAFATAASPVLRGQDRLGRWGGEEWLLVMPGTRIDEAAAVFRRLRERLASTPVDGLPADERRSFSMGAAEANSRWRDLDTLIAQADGALYRAKQSGRDRLELAVPDTAT